MKFVPQSIAVAEGDGFKNDLLGRKEFGDRLTNLVSALGGSSTLFLDGPWGSGKTTFVRMWGDTLKTKQVPVIYFNAFDNDYLNDAFTALAGEFVAVDAANDTAKDKFLGAAVKIGKSLAVHGSRYAVKAATLGVVDVLELKDVVGGVAEDIAKDAGDSASAIIKGKLLARKTERVAMEQFRNELAAYVADISGKDVANAKTPEPLVFIIDELDRCKPDFALALIEGVKHLFNVPGVVFVLVTNLEQMCGAVRATYGSIDARSYLEKFYHLMVVLPEPNREGAEHAIEHFLESIFREMPSDIRHDKLRWGDVHQHMIKHLMLLKARKALTLRKLERLATQIAVVYASTRDSQLRLASIIADLCLMKGDAPELYRLAREGTLTLPELETFLPYKKWFDENPDNSDRDLVWAADVWRYFLGEKDFLSGESKDEFSSRFARYGFRMPRRMFAMVCDWIDGFAFPKQD